MVPRKETKPVYENHEVEMDDLRSYTTPVKLEFAFSITIYSNKEGWMVA